MMKLILYSLLTTVLLISVPAAEAQPPKKVHWIGYLLPGDATSESARVDGVRLALRERGYVEGQNIAAEYRYAKGKGDQFSELAADLVRLNVDIIVVSGGNTPVRAVKNATKTIPIVMADGSDPVEAGLVESLARPGGNVTGITTLGRELDGKRLELFKKAVPKITRVAVLYNPANRAQVSWVKEDLPVVGRGLKFCRFNLGRYAYQTISTNFLLRQASSDGMDFT